MPGCCAVVGCRNRFVRGGKHFYRFPKDEQQKKLWIKFTRKGLTFDTKKCSAVCEDHFAEDRVVVKKKGRMYLIKKTVPTIYYRETKEGLERVIVEFDEISNQYIGQESVNLLRGTVSAQEEKNIVRDRRQKVKELKNLCRFCFESQDEKFVAISKLEAYSIDPDEMLILVGVGLQYNHVFSEIVCEQCFQQIVSIDGYRKRCKKAQDEVVMEMQELDLKLQNIRSMKADENPWFKYEAMSDDEPSQTHIEIIEEHLDDNISYDEVGDEDEDFQDESFDVTNDFNSYKMEIQNDPKEFQQIIIKEECKIESVDDIMEQNNHSFEAHYENDEDDDDDDEFQGMPEPSDKDVYNITDTEAIIRNPDRNSFALRIYECFFCRLVRETPAELSVAMILNLFNYCFRNLPVKKLTKLTTVR